MKGFLDQACGRFNASWPADEASIREDIAQFDAAVDVLIDIFGEDGLARKPGSRSFNRAIFDALIFYAADQEIRDAMAARPETVRATYSECLNAVDFSEAIESDTAGIPHTLARIRLWGEVLGRELGLQFAVPRSEITNEGLTRIAFDGLR